MPEGKPLELSLEERIALAQLTNHPGWDILVRLIGHECEEATKAVIRLDPEKAGVNYPLVLASRQQTARAVNGFASSLLKNVKYNNETAVVELQRQNAGDSEDPQTAVGRFKFPDLRTAEQKDSSNFPAEGKKSN